MGCAHVHELLKLGQLGGPGHVGELLISIVQGILRTSSQLVALSGLRGSKGGVLLPRTMFRRPSRPSKSGSDGRWDVAVERSAAEPLEEYCVFGDDPQAVEEGVTVVYVR